MIFVLDENFPQSALALLESHGHQAVDIGAKGLAGSRDEVLFEHCQSLKGIFLATDRDFFHTIPYAVPDHHGIVVIALRQPSRKHLLDRLEWFLEGFSQGEIHGRAFQRRDRTWMAYPPPTD